MDEQKLLETFGFNLKMARMRLKLTQDDMADITNFSKSYISNVECGRHSLSLVNALIFAKAVNVDITKLLDM